MARIVALLILVFHVAGAWAQAPAGPMSADERTRQLESAWKAASAVARHGPASVTLLDQGTIAVPNGAAYIPLPEAAALMRAMGNTVRPNMVGILTGSGNDDDWLALLTFVKEGYIKDDDAREWNADDLLASLKEGTEQANADRRASGFPALQIVGWIEKPAYDQPSHRLVWSVNARVEGRAPDAGQTVNYNTYVLGREGYFSLNMLSTEQRIAQHRLVARELLAGLGFVDGKRYEQFDAGTDKIAAYGLAALVGGAALKKVGLFAVIAAFALKFAKFGLILLVPLFWLGSKLFGRRSSGRGS